MAEEKKFIDQKGVEYLWSQLSLEDYPNNEVLMAILNAIDTTKQNKNIIVSKDSDGLATLSSVDIATAIAEGTTVYFRKSESETLQEYLEGGAEAAVFHSNFIDNDNLQSNIYIIDQNKNITEYNYSNTNAENALSEAKSYTDTAVANLINSAPETLDTLNELAIAIQEHQNVTDALDAAITNKADKTTTEAAITDLQSKDNSFEATFALLNPETWTFTLTDGSTVSKQVVLYTK